MSAWLAAAAWAQAETITSFEAADGNGVSTWNGSYPVTMSGVLLTDPGEMLDATGDFIPWNDGAGQNELGGQWQVFVQAVAPGDRGGVECWMGQNYGNLPWLHNSDLSYSNDAWDAEVNRVSHDPATGHAFRKGDLVTVVANGSLFYGGMQNINEEHSTDPSCDFTISLVSSNSGLPDPEVISLASVMRLDDGNAATHEDIFDPHRATGGEHWQGMRVRLNGLTLVTTNGWSSDLHWDSRKCEVTDGEGRRFTLVHPRYSLGPAPSDRFDATGVFLQESGSGTDGTFGYELFVQEITPSATPVLTITRYSGVGVVVGWPGSLANSRLESADVLSSPQWLSVTNSSYLAEGTNTVTVPLGAAPRWFRLRRMQ
jgi:hypothetical protein